MDVSVASGKQIVGSTEGFLLPGRQIFQNPIG